MASLNTRYFKAMMNGHTRICIEIEQDAGLYGYPPEIVSVGLAALENGKDAHEAIEQYMKQETSHD